MKRAITAALMMISASMFFSCKKAYTCTCKAGTEVKSQKALDKQKKKDAVAECKGMEGPTVVGTVTVMLSCNVN